MGELEQIGDRLLVIFDGYCVHCNRAVRWFLRHDERDRLRFVASDSPKVAGFLVRLGISATDYGLGSATTSPSTILVVRNLGGQGEQVLVRSEAALALLGELPQPWRAVSVAMGWIPRWVRDLGYRLIARWRYRIWGRLESCPVPTAAERERFL